MRKLTCEDVRTAFRELKRTHERFLKAFEGGRMDRNLKPAKEAKVILQEAIRNLYASFEVFEVFVDYTRPTYEELRFKRGFVFLSGDTHFDNFQAIEACKNVSRKPRMIRFEYFRIPHDAASFRVSMEAVLAELRKRGMRPALYEELLAFDAAYPDAQRRGALIVALGSVGRNGDALIVPALGNGTNERELGVEYVGDEFQFQTFLVVREDA